MKNVFDIGNFVDLLTPNSVMQKLVEREKQRRKKLNITQRQLSVKSGVAYASIRRFESTGEISFSSLLNIANALDCLDDFNQLFRQPAITNLKDLKV
jgi:transcriptional regulator with XRE-family HTH domain